VTTKRAKFTFGQRIVLAVVPRVVWALLWMVSRTWRFETIAEEGVTPLLFGAARARRFSASGINACCRARFISHNGGNDSYQPQLRRRTRYKRSQLVRLSMRCAARVRVARAKGCWDWLHMIESETAIFTADGPRGPIYQTKMGPIKLAQMTGAPHWRISP
jgi:hypothetical protein